MEIRSLIRRIITITLLISICFLLQTSVFSHLELAGVTPNFLLIVTTVFGFMRGRREGTIVGFFCGLLLDLFFSSHLGMYALIYLLIGYLNGFFKKQFFGDDIKLPLVLVGASDVVYNGIIYIVLFLTRGRTSVLFYVLNIILPEAVYTVLISFVVYFVIFKLNQWLEKREKRSERYLG